MKINIDNQSKILTNKSDLLRIIIDFFDNNTVQSGFIHVTIKKYFGKKFKISVDCSKTNIKIIVGDV